MTRTEEIKLIQNNAPLIIMYVSGNTFPVREWLKEQGFKWDKDSKEWIKNYFLVDGVTAGYVKNLKEAWEADGQLHIELTSDLD